METNEIIDNSFIIDLSNAKDTLEVVNELTNILDLAESKGKEICLKLRDIELSKSQLLGISALVSATGSTLKGIDSNCDMTKESAKELDINIMTINSNLQVLNKDEAEEHKDEEDLSNSELNSDDSMAEEESAYEIFKTEEIKEESKESDLPTLYLQQTLRSGQTLSYDGNILVIGDTHPGSELIAKGDITVWGVLGGIAHAGTSGDKSAKIRALKLNAIQLRIAGIYAGRLNTENIPYIQRSNEFTPQEARIENDNLVIRNINSEL